MLRYLSKLFGLFGEKDLLVFLIGFSIFSVGFWFKGGDCYTCIGFGNDDINMNRTTMMGQCTSRKYQDIVSEVKKNEFMFSTCVNSIFELHSYKENLEPFECLHFQISCICSDSDAFRQHHHWSNYSSNYQDTCRCVIPKELCDKMRVMQLVEAVFWSGFVTIFRVYLFIKKE